MTLAHSSIARPPRRLLTRVLLPLIIIVGAIAAVLWAGWRSFAPALPVRVVQVVQKSSSGGSQFGDDSGTIIQAPGWIEPAPYPVMVSALTPGTVKDVLVLEGERVTKGQVLAELFDEEQTIDLRLATAMLTEQEARLAEMADELQRKQQLVASGSVAQAEVARLKLRIAGMEAAVSAAEAERDLKALMLERTKVRAPRDGVVMARLASPGMPAGSMTDGKPLLELYDPSQLQVRADVPLADAGFIAVGQTAEIHVDVLPNRTFHGTVSRIVQQADIAKNTVQAKIAIADPAAELKPEMLARVRVLARPVGATDADPATGADGEGASPTQASATSGRLRLWAPLSGLVRADTRSLDATALVVMELQDNVGIAEARSLKLTGQESDGWVEVASGLRAGDMLIETAGAQPKPGQRVRVTGGSDAHH